MEATLTKTPINLELGHGGDCARFANPLFLQLAEGHYDMCSVMPLPASLEEWRAEHRTARKRADRCQRLGYRFVRVQRGERADEIHGINMSADIRQGRPMSDGYRKPPPSTDDPEWMCERHGVHPYGVENADGTLVAYLWVYRAGELALVSQILGHAAHLENGIMYLLWEGMLTCEPTDDCYVVYNRHDSGTDGLRFYKERVGLMETAVAWRP